MRRLFLVFLAEFMLLQCSCISRSQRDRGVETQVPLGIDIGVVNTGSERIDNATVAFGAYEFSVGIISPGKKKVHVCSGQPVPEHAKISILFADGKKVVQTVAVRPHLPEKHPADLVLHFNVNGEQDIAVEFLHFIEFNGRYQLVPVVP